MIIKVVISILSSNRCASLQVGPIISTSARSPLGFPNIVCFICPKLHLFSHPPILFLQGLRLLNQVSLLLMGSLSILSRQCSYTVILRKILTKLQVRLSSLIFFSGGSNSSFVDHILFPRFKYLLMSVHLLIINFSLFNCSGVLKISRRFVFTLCIRSRSFEDVPSFKPFNSTGAFSLLNRSTVFLLSGP